MFCVPLRGGKAVDQPVPGGFREGPPPGTDHGGPVGAGPAGWREDALAAHRHSLLVSNVVIGATAVHFRSCGLLRRASLTTLP